VKHERSVGSVSGVTESLDPEITAADEGDLRLLQDPLYAERVRHWLGEPKKLLDWRHTMARAQALADMLEDRVRRGGVTGVVPPPLLAAIDQLRQMHLAIRRLEATADDVTHIHVSLVDALLGNMMAVLTEFVPPERLEAAIDKLHTLQAAAVPRRGANGRSTSGYG
jgi:hypothetical protein